MRGIMKKIYGIFAGAMLAVLLTGCGDGSEAQGGASQTGDGGIAVVSGEPVLAKEELDRLNYETKYSKGEFSEEDYQALARIYAEAGLIRKQRDMLEQSYRLFAGEEAFAQLQELAVNLEEEDAEIAEAVQTMLQNLELSEYLGEAIHMIGSREWLETMMPRLSKGQRNYFLAENGAVTLSVQAGYDEMGIPFSNVWRKGAEGQVTLLQRYGSTVQLMNTALSEAGAYEGAFEAWRIDRADSSIYHEQGTFSGGAYTGDYTVELHRGTEAGDFFDLFSNREGMSYTLFAGSFGGEGKTALEQPSDAQKQKLLAESGSDDCVVYAHSEDEKEWLYLETAKEETESYRFTAESMGKAAYPGFVFYEVKEKISQEKVSPEKAAPETTSPDGQAQDAQAQNEGLQVRIFDGQVQYLNGDTWVSAGSVSSLQKEDPFYAYEKEREAYLNTADSTSQGLGKYFQTGQAQEEGSGAAQKPSGGADQKPSGGASSKPPAANKPAAPSGQKPSSGGGAAQNQPAPPATPQQPPADNSSDDEDDSDSGSTDNGGSSDTGSTDNGGGSGSTDNGGGSGSPDAGGGNSGDVDIEWSPDIM